MRVGRYLVTTEDFIGPDGPEKRLRFARSEELPDFRRAKIRQLQVDELRRILNKLDSKEASSLQRRRDEHS